MIEHWYRNWYFVFVPRGEMPRRWYHLLNIGRFDHCFALRYDGEKKQWLFADWNHLGLFFELATQDQINDTIATVRLAGGEFVKYRPCPDISYRPQIAPLNYCVPTMAALANIRKIMFWPDQLYRALLDRGGQLSFTSIEPMRQE